LLAPPSILMRNDGPGMPTATLLAHSAHAAIIRGFASIAG
jgi:hypothetical protein